MNAVQDIATDDLKTETDVTRSAFTVRISGRAEAAAVAELDAFLKRLHQSASVARVPEVIIDIRALDVLTPECFEQFVTWINVLQESRSDTQYRVRFVADEKKHWQNRSVGALACFAVDLVRLEN